MLIRTKTEQTLSIILYLFAAYQDNPIFAQNAINPKCETTEYLKEEARITSEMFLNAVPLEQQNLSKKELTNIAKEFWQGLPVKFKKRYKVEWLISTYLDQRNTK